jgi:membrane protein DedA with SNARE-associated domain
MSIPTTLALAAIAAATLVSEDATAVGTGIAVGDGRLALLPALVACGAGIYLGDLGLWAAGRFAGRRVLGWRVMRAHAASVTALGAWIDRRPALAVLGSRFVPGTRLPLYVAAGLSGTRDAAFFIWALVAVALWTPLIVGLGLWLGAAVAGPLQAWTGVGAWGARAALVAAVAVGLKRIAVPPAATGRLPAGVERWRRWEFWPAWLFNLPVVLWCVLLAARHRSLTVFTCANPGMPDGGFVGESKSAILARLPQAWVVPWASVAPGALESRVAAVRATLAARGWSYPIVFKPDVGQRGSGVRWLPSEDDVRRYLAAERGKVVLQVPHEGPYEAGVFYVRHPGERCGRIFSITDKRFPVVTGDGSTTLAGLVARHDRYRLQLRVFLARLGGSRTRVPAPGERVPLGRAGNHCQGTEFLDGRWMATPALERRVDAIARQCDGFFFGRFDVRYRDRAAFMNGDDFAILELNGVSSEATHVYDPSGSLFQAWRTLMRQWSIAFAVGAANRAGGCRPSSVRRVIRLVWTFARQAPVHPLAD